ncbi:MAG TPA: 4'-phosphopantetheinyl transferase superfamily protein [Puia sp.]|nr:4'-phosphopantetheinyl transferase superfamily protein [Puia sp.]
MMSTGNDIVALAETDSDRTSRHRFYSRILSPGELSLFPDYGMPYPDHPGPPPRLSFPDFVWLMWSIKESVYKYVSRADRRLDFAPLKIPVTWLRFRDDFYEGMISYRQCALYSRSFFIPGETIMTVVNEKADFGEVRWGMRIVGDSCRSTGDPLYPDYSAQSAYVREFALQSLSKEMSGAALRIIKTPDGPPEVWDSERCLEIPISLAHHGPYVAWSYRLPGDGSHRLSANSSSYRKSAANRAASSHLRRVNLLEITGLNRSCSSCEYSS